MPLADRFTASPDPINVGAQLTICFHNAALANQTVTVEINDAGSNSDSVQIQLDADGYGCTTWTVPAWAGAVLTHPTSQDHAVIINP